jgi:hypothetical protein
VNRAVRAGAAVLAVAVIGCSGGGGSGSDVAAFTTQANAVCTKLTADDTAGRAALGASPAPQAIIDYVRGSYAPTAIAAYQQIGALPLPKGKEEAIIALLTDAQAEVKLQQVDPINGGSKPLERELVGRLHAAGLTECGAGFAPALDHAEFIAEAGVICTRVFSDIVQEQKNRGIIFTTPADRKATFVTDTVVPVARGGLDDLRAIGIPPGDAATVTKILTDLQAEIDQLAADPTRLGLVDARHLAIEAGWKAYGVGVCALYEAPPS